MARSQRHKVLVQSASAVGSVYEQHVIAPAVLLDTGEYTTPGGAPGGPLQGSSIAGPPPAGVAVPTISSLSPNTAVVGGAPLVMTVTGTNFNITSTIMFNNGAEPTTFISPTQVSTGVKPATASGPATVPVSVSNAGVQESNALNFTFTAAGLMSGEDGGERSFPIGPVSLVRIEDDDTGIALIVPAGSGIQLGDTVLVEASFDSNINGSYEVISVDGDRVVVDNGYTLAAPIEAKGRVTVTAGG